VGFRDRARVQQKLDWMRAFIEREIQPLEPILDEPPPTSGPP
jgi:hypothetical protein